jgi:heme-degrading monooxygenase HmoA
MIARIWHGAVPTHKSNEYLRLMREVAVPDYRSVPGNHEAFVLRQTNGEITDFIMLTFWDSKDAIAKFAGADIETAKYYKFDRDFLIELEPQVKHYELYEGSACDSE